jgi:hypothetical protein
MRKIFPTLAWGVCRLGPGLCARHGRGFATRCNRRESHLSRRFRVRASTLALYQSHNNVQSGTSLRAVGGTKWAGALAFARTPAFGKLLSLEHVAQWVRQRAASHRSRATRDLITTLTDHTPFVPTPTDEAALLLLLLLSAATAAPVALALGLELLSLSLAHKRREHSKHRTYESCAGQLYRPAPRDGALSHAYGQVVEGSFLDLSPQHRWSFLVFGSSHRASLPTSANKIRTLR